MTWPPSASSGCEDEELMLITELFGTILRTEVGGINRYRRASRGVTVMKPGQDSDESSRSRSSSTTGFPRISPKPNDLRPAAALVLGSYGASQ